MEHTPVENAEISPGSLRGAYQSRKGSSLGTSPGAVLGLLPLPNRVPK